MAHHVVALRPVALRPIALRPIALRPVLLLLIAALLSLTPARAAALPDADASTRLVVAFAERGMSEAEVAARLARHGARLERWLPELGLARVSVAGDLARIVETRLADERDIRFVAEHRKSARIADAPLDEHWSEQWGAARVGLPEAREVTRGYSGVVIAVLDTGVNYRHRDLRGQMRINPGEAGVDPATGAPTCEAAIAQNGVDDDGNGYADDCRGYNFDADSPDPIDEHGHGTVVAGIAGAATNNGEARSDGSYEGIAGMGGASRLMAVRTLDAGGYGWAFNIAEGVTYAANNGATVINLSLTLGPAPSQNDIRIMCEATGYALSRGVVVVAASGNDSRYGLRPVSYPAACPGVIAVGASTRDDARAVFSNASERLDLVAPGEWITSTLRTSDTAYGIFGQTGSGTSFAAPHVAGAAALIRAVRPDYMPEQVRDLLRASADDLGEPGRDPLTGSGRLNAAHAVRQAAAQGRLYLPTLAR